MPLSLRIVIIEDEESAVNRLIKELKKLEALSFEVVVSFENVQDSVEWFRGNNEADLVFMDIQLADGVSFEIFNQVDVTIPVIFTTAYDEYALQAFKVNGLDYLLKPIDPTELKSALDKFLSQSRIQPKDTYQDQLKQLASDFKQEKYRSSFLVNFKQKMIMIDVKEVAFIYIKERGAFLRKKDNKEYVIEFFLDELEKQLDPSEFYRANRQFMVARSSIVEIEPYFTGRLILNINPEPPSPVIISKEKASDFKRWADY
ncbi:MAG: LytTR family DNA-binding domain-containing protein [bacterium]|nr:LytTR family DNA-binding domain-containing protein [bacterium]